MLWTSRLASLLCRLRASRDRMMALCCTQPIRGLLTVLVSGQFKHPEHTVPGCWCRKTGQYIWSWAAAVYIFVPLTAHSKMYTKYCSRFKVSTNFWTEDPMWPWGFRPAAPAFPRNTGTLFCFDFLFTQTIWNAAIWSLILCTHCCFYCPIRLQCCVNCVQCVYWVNREVTLRSSFRQSSREGFDRYWQDWSAALYLLRTIDYIYGESSKWQTGKWDENERQKSSIS